MTRREYFSFPERTDQFDKSLTGLIQNLTRIESAKLISPENEMRYNHGKKWVAVSSSASDEEGEMKEHSTEITLNMKDIREHKLTALPFFINDIVTQMVQSLRKTVFETVSESCEKT